MNIYFTTPRAYFDTSDPADVPCVYCGAVEGVTVHEESCVEEYASDSPAVADEGMRRAA